LLMDAGPEGAVKYVCCVCQTQTLTLVFSMGL
jgi:hypothetical protein